MAGRLRVVRTGRGLLDSAVRRFLAFSGAYKEQTEGQVNDEEIKVGRGKGGRGKNRRRKKRRGS